MLTENNVKNFAFKFKNIIEKKVIYLMRMLFKDIAKQFYKNKTLIELNFLFWYGLNFVLF